MGIVFGVQQLGQPEQRLERLCLLFHFSPKLTGATRSAPTLTATPAQPDSATPNGKSLHFLNGPLCVSLAYKLHEAAVLSNWDFDLSIS